MTQTTEKIAYRPQEASNASGVSKATIERAIRNGDLRSVKLGGARLILAESLHEWLRSGDATA